MEHTANPVGSTLSPNKRGYEQLEVENITTHKGRKPKYKCWVENHLNLSHQCNFRPKKDNISLY
ncbi:uncharacterized protein G2W53_029534 [Senna tora]|uniref:Uncharacterized protein n=1 Tax=Senna tora TaxID=362788 RepID=A0A834T5S9_9FABA|nr:uncharacterized protein G2W53_029534 [Senna tora]